MGCLGSRGEVWGLGFKGLVPFHAQRLARGRRKVPQCGKIGKMEVERSDREATGQKGVKLDLMDGPFLGTLYLRLQDRMGPPKADHNLVNLPGFRIHMGFGTRRPKALTSCELVG